MSRLTVAAAILCGTTLLAQQVPVFRTGVQLVTVDVVVTDADDRPIRDLTIADFELVDRGRAQTITNFRFVDIPPVSSVASDTPAPISDVVTNGRPATDSRLFVLVVDALHTLESEMVPMKEVMTTFVETVAPTDEVAVVYVGRSDLGTNFTTDPARLRAAIDDLRSASGFAVDVLGRTGNSDLMRGKSDVSMYGRDLAATLKQTARALAGSPHARRAIVYVGAGTAANLSGDDRTDWVLRDAMNDAYTTARQHNVPIYLLDPRGMVQAADAVRGGVGAIGPAQRDLALIGLRYQRDQLATAAVNTGGRALLEQSDISGAMRSIVAENGAFYLLGFYPSQTPLANTFNEIEVRVTRPGAKVRARAGYQGAAAPVDPTTSLAEQLMSSMQSALDVRGLTLRAAVAPLLPADKVTRTAVTVHVTYPMQIPPDLPFDSLQLHLLAVDGDGKTKAEVQRGYTVRPPRSDREAVAVVINDVIDLPPQPLTLRIGVASQALGRAGTLQLPVHAPKPNESALQLGAIVIGTPNAPGPPTLGAEYIKALVPFQPNTRRSFTAAQTLRVFAPMFWKGSHTEAQVTLTLTGTGVTLRRQERVPVVSTQDGMKLTSLDTLIGLDKLSGPFTLTIEASVNGTHTASRQVSFTVAPSAAAREAPVRR